MWLVELKAICEGIHYVLGLRGVFADSDGSAIIICICLAPIHIFKPVVVV